MNLGQIRQSLSGFYDVMDTDGELHRTRARGNFRNRKITPLVGDWVEFDDTGKYILKIRDRKNSLVRPPIANIDQAIVATAVAEPAFSSNLLDRQLITLEIANIKPVIYFTKTDLIDDEAYNQIAVLADYYERVGYPTFLARDAFEPAQLDGLKQQLSKKESVIMGQTGAGKSTLLNHLAPDLELATGEISKALNRGKHTTRKVGLLEIGDGLIADTPGFSSYDLMQTAAVDLTKYLPEFVELGASCRFRGCVHVNEPGCAVKEAVASGQVIQSRYDNYLQLYVTLKNQKPNYKK
ncbi:GTPase [Secundilactobacillus oryzae JCM 18671]|uniref:Small ribosomal subunit biogenesis GTPase RsgA n=1 Tax=Secundilactobacillus oryzae JCM 18671 TaxID=1291743 RepID=A0A081BFV1_9LACO|nr:ribosome small subunit-dependent GTPase A [Secundilactobacillus oryzae]GAK46919.1 GTPase [Secundilactobacillus oryzae JCM 18671]